MPIDPDVTQAMDAIDYATCDPINLRNTVNQIIKALSSTERVAQIPPDDPRVEIPELSGENIGEVVQATRRNVIAVGVGFAPSE